MKYGFVIFVDIYCIVVILFFFEIGSIIIVFGKDCLVFYEMVVFLSFCRGFGGSYGSKGGKGKIVIVLIIECVVFILRNFVGFVSFFYIVVFINFFFYFWIYI